jgi:deazaflavin-dependent oxidoreductase (nitroreductase family)
MSENTTQNLQSKGAGKGPGRLSRWFQRRANVKTVERIRRKGGTFMGMELLILHTVGRRSGADRQSAVAWFDDGGGGWLIIASGGGDRNPDWYTNLVAHPDRAAVEVYGSEPVQVTPHLLEGAEREPAWNHIAAAQPRIAKYQSKSDRVYPVVRLTARSQTEK